MKYLYILTLPLLAGCAALREAGTAVANVGGAVLDEAGNLTGIGGDTIVAATGGDPSSILSMMTLFGIPPWITGPLALLLAMKRSRGHIFAAGKSLKRAIGGEHSSEASEKAAS